MLKQTFCGPFDTFKDKVPIVITLSPIQDNSAITTHFEMVS